MFRNPLGLLPAAPDSGRRFVVGSRQVGIEEGESLADTGFLAQREGGHDPSGRESAIAKHFRKGALLILDDESRVAADAGLERETAGQQRDVSGKGLRIV